jgi:AcrR family transcriptional regulator
MLEKGINTLKISDIAKKVKIGEATIYRYFGTKTNIVIEVGVSLWKDIFNQLSKLPEKENGYESVKAFFSFFLEGYKSYKEVFIFLDQFDSLMVKEKVSKELLKPYDYALYEVKKIYDDLYACGLNDESIRKDLNPDEFYYTTTHMILGICKRLATNGDILPSDDLVQDIVQIKLALDICLEYIKRK